MEKHPLEQFNNFPIAFAYKLSDGTVNVMTNGAWTWYYKEHQQGTIHEFGNHSFTYDNAYTIEEMSMVFLPPTELSEKLLLVFGSNSAYDEGNHQSKVFLFEEHGFNWKDMIHEEYPTWKVKPIDVHDVGDVFTLVSTEFISQHNGFPHERIMDVERKMYKVIKGELDK